MPSNFWKANKCVFVEYQSNNNNRFMKDILKGHLGVFSIGLWETVSWKPFIVAIFLFNLIFWKIFD